MKVTPSALSWTTPAAAVPSSFGRSILRSPWAAAVMPPATMIRLPTTRTLASVRPEMVGRRAAMLAPPRIRMATVRAMAVDACSGTARRIREMKNITLAIVARPSTGMPIGIRLMWRPVDSEADRASQPAPAARATSIPA
ncbi:MAG TPA: hypothetical protein VL337_15030 [Acidimicrobiales bacterium]|nr:hypothetical protein [Acidimicrobiales bacterium]